MKNDMTLIQSKNQTLNLSLVHLADEMPEYQYYAIPQRIRTLCKSKDLLLEEYLITNDPYVRREINKSLTSHLNMLYCQLLIAGDIGLLNDSRNKAVKSEIRAFSELIKDKEL